MILTDWIVIAVILAMLTAVFFFDRWIKKKYPDL